jgi:hypothetical protein
MLTKHQNAENEASRWLGNANEAAEAGDKKLEEKCLQKSQFWLDRANRLAGNGDGGQKTPPLTPVQRRVLDDLAKTESGSAAVGRGCSLKCNRTTARSLVTLGYASATDELRESDATFVLSITAAGKAAVSP